MCVCVFVCLYLCVCVCVYVLRMCTLSMSPVVFLLGCLIYYFLWNSKKFLCTKEISPSWTIFFANIYSCFYYSSLTFVIELCLLSSLWRKSYWSSSCMKCWQLSLQLSAAPEIVSASIYLHSARQVFWEEPISNDCLRLR